MMRLRLLVCASLVALAIGTTLVGPSQIVRPAVAANGCLAQHGLSDPGNALPVILVHGYTGTVASMEPLASSLRVAGINVSVDVFDYESNSRNWVDNPNIGPRLSEAIRCLSDASVEASGPGRVAVVAHSMGGLATREALSNVSSNRLAIVITLGTPHNGSFWAGRYLGEQHEAVAPIVDLLEHTSIPVIRDLDSEAARALAQNSPQLAALPDWPDGLPVRGIAGSITATERFLFWSRESDLGDLVVDTESATARTQTVDRLGGADTLSCDILVPNDLTLIGVAAAYSGQIEQILGCYHGYLMTSEPITSDVIAQLAATPRKSRLDHTISLDRVGPVRLGMDPDTAVRVGELEFERDDICSAEVDGSTEDDSYSMPSLPGPDIEVVVESSGVLYFSVDGEWSTDFGVSSGQNVNEIAERFRSAGWDVHVSGEDDIFSAGRLEAWRGDQGFTVESDEQGRATWLYVPRPIYCD